LPTLSIERTASDGDVKAAFRRQAMQWHGRAERIVGHLADIVVDQLGQRRIGDSDPQAALVWRRW
jgi:hypothetical protein